MKRGDDAEIQTRITKALNVHNSKIELQNRNEVIPDKLQK
jgi:hypothetical protein